MHAPGQAPVLRVFCLTIGITPCCIFTSPLLNSMRLISSRRKIPEDAA